MVQVSRYRHIFLLIIGITLLVFVTACAGSDAPQQPAPDNAEPVMDTSGSVSASCDATVMLGFCYDYTGPGWTQDKIELDCGIVEENLLQDQPCSQETVVATCNFDLQGNSDLAIKYYFYEPTDLTTAERMCPGTFFPAE